MATRTYNVREVLESIGYKLKRVGASYMTNAVYRGGDNPTALGIHTKTGGWHDFVTGDSGTLKQLVERTIGKEFDGEIEIERVDDAVDYIERDIPKVKVFDPKSLENLLPAFDYWNNRGISDDTLKYFKNGLAHRNEMYQRSVFPIVNPDGKIYGFAGRSVLPERQPKWKIVGKKTNFIYPVYFNAQYIAKEDYIILIESIGDMLGLWEAGIKNTLCTFGTAIFPKTMCYLLSLNKTIIIATNNDESAEKNWGYLAAEKMRNKLLEYFDEQNVKIFLPFKKDFNDQTTTENLRWHEDLLKILNK